MPLNPDVLQKLCTEVYRQFPVVSGCKPKVQAYTAGQYLLIFQAGNRTANGMPISTTVRAVVTQAGKVVKVSTSKG